MSITCRDLHQGVWIGLSASVAGKVRRVRDRRYGGRRGKSRRTPLPPLGLELPISSGGSSVVAHLAVQAHQLRREVVAWSTAWIAEHQQDPMTAVVGE
jgi:hypothetical protein